MDESSYCLESLINLIYLAKHSANDAEAVVHYLTQAEEQAARLVAFHRQMIGMRPAESTD